jgi:mono/diheme cytochrome c family protein
MALAQWPQIPALSAPAFLEARSSDSIVTVAHNGVDKDMPARKGQLTREQIVAIAQYVRSLVPPKSP